MEVCVILSSGDIGLGGPRPFSLYLELGWLPGAQRLPPPPLFPGETQASSLLGHFPPLPTFRDLMLPRLEDTLTFWHFYQVTSQFCQEGSTNKNVPD